MTELPNANLALRWLRRVRWALLSAELAFVVLARAELLDPLPLLPIGAVCGAIALGDALQSTVLRRRPDLRTRAVGVHVVFDLIALATLVSLSPDAHQPLQVFFIVEPAVAATVLRPVQSVGSAAGGALLLAAAVLVPGGLRADPELWHLASHAALLGFATVTTTWFVSQLAGALHRAEAARAATERLAALGTLAAGVAHELATPLGTVGVLADEVALPDATDADRARAHRGLHEQLVRCRDLLRRLKSGPGELDGRTEALDTRLVEWIGEWSRSNAMLQPTLRVDTDSPRSVRGADERWRGALWTVLDNARRAGGADRIEVTLRRAGPAGGPFAELVVEDRGCGVDAEVAERAGEPFFSGWRGGTEGRGLGLFAARTFARAVGGDIVLEARAGGGARAILRLPGER
jgi:two-component system, sensor histidine kinase RegB